VQNGKPTKPVNSFRKSCLDHCLVADVTVDKVSLPSRILGSSARGFRGCLAARNINFRDHDLCALFCKPLRSCPADTATPAGDECNFACKARHENSFCVMLSLSGAKPLLR
jgi:hypothetical protein